MTINRLSDIEGLNQHPLSRKSKFLLVMFYENCIIDNPLHPDYHDTTKLINATFKQY